LLCRENSLDPNLIKGSYAGALGKPQFISSSYRNYAIDFDGDNDIDVILMIPEVSSDGLKINYNFNIYLNSSLF